MKLTIKSMSRAILAILFAIVLACGFQVETVKAEEMEPTQPTTPTEQQTQQPMSPTIMPTMPTMPTILPSISKEMLKEFPPCKPGESELIVCNPNPEK